MFRKKDEEGGGRGERTPRKEEEAMMRV